jgi:septal ring factor EnvC (AmiA/AmiB activator)
MTAYSFLVVILTGFEYFGRKTCRSQQACRCTCSKLEQSEKARKEAEVDAKKAKADAEKAKADAAGVEDLRKRLHDAETALSDKIAEQAAREEKILSRLEAQSRRFVSKCSTLCALPRVTSHFPSTFYLRATLCLFTTRKRPSRKITISGAPLQGAPLLTYYQWRTS